MSEEDDFMMLRNVHPHFVDNGRVGSGGFIPSAEHEYQLSVDFNILSTPAESRKRHEKTFGLASAGVFGVTIGEFSKEKIECRSDPLVNNEAHALADFEDVKAVSNKNVRNTGRRLATVATHRGKLD